MKILAKMLVLEWNQVDFCDEQEDLGKKPVQLSHYLGDASLQCHYELLADG